LELFCNALNGCVFFSTDFILGGFMEMGLSVGFLLMSADKILMCGACIS
jgi:hypothetical protein